MSPPFAARPGAPDSNRGGTDADRGEAQAGLIASGPTGTSTSSPAWVDPLPDIDELLPQDSVDAGQIAPLTASVPAQRPTSDVVADTELVDEACLHPENEKATISKIIGEVQRGLLLSAWGWSTIGTMVWVAGLVLALLGAPALAAGSIVRIRASEAAASRASSRQPACRSDRRRLLSRRLRTRCPCPGRRQWCRSRWERYASFRWRRRAGCTRRLVR